MSAQTRPTTAATGQYPYAYQPLTLTRAMQQIGSTGLRRIGAWVYEEFLTELQGRIGRAKYREMSLNNATIKRGLRAYKYPLLRPKITVEGGEGPEAVVKKAQEFLLTCMDDMLAPFRAYLWEGLSFLEYGSAWCQTLYKVCKGPDQTDPALRSQYDDNLVRWLEFSFRGQETWDGWEWDELGRMIALRQFDPYGAGFSVIPLDRSVHWKFEGRVADPEGESILRNCYFPYRWQRDLQISQIIRNSRDATGIPVFQVEDSPDAPRLWDQNDANMIALLAYLEKMGANLRMDDQSSVIMPRGMTFRLEQSPGQSQVNIDETIRRLDWQMLGSMLAQFLELGQAQHGSFAKSQSDQNFFETCLEGILTYTLIGTLNTQEIPRLFKLNAGSFRGLVKPPHFTAGRITETMLSEIAQPLQWLIQAGALLVDDPLRAWVRDVAGAPPEDPDTALPSPQQHQSETGEGDAASGQTETDEEGDIGKSDRAFAAHLARTTQLSHRSINDIIAGKHVLETHSALHQDPEALRELVDVLKALGKGERDVH